MMRVLLHETQHSTSYVCTDIQFTLFMSNSCMSECTIQIYVHLYSYHILFHCFYYVHSIQNSLAVGLLPRALLTVMLLSDDVTRSFRHLTLSDCQFAIHTCNDFGLVLVIKTIDCCMLLLRLLFLL